MVSYFKTQWWRLLCALLCFIYCVVIVCTSTSVADSVDGVYMVMKDVFRFILWFLASCFWMITSFTSHNSDCIRELNKRVQYLEARAITDIEETGPNEYTVRRKLGPDKEDS
jgi:hypothetical protein